MKKTKVIVGLGSCGIAAGAGKTYQEFDRIRKADRLDFELRKTSCVGMCFREPLVEIIDDSGSYLYGQVDPSKADEIIEKHIKNFSPIPEYIVQSEKYPSADESF